ncbi:MAG: diaminopimelate decarboxylase [Chloroflexi bacterium]|nr:diaminopimelate decarboxylase [Chloroflexota bacterium]
MVFPLSTRVNDQNHLEISGCDLVTLAQCYGTPLYIFDELHLRNRAREIRRLVEQALMKNGVSGGLLLYATKAYFSPFLAHILRDAGWGIEVTSEGELEVARRVDFPSERIYLHGNNKTPAEIRAAFALGVRHVVVDGLSEIELLNSLADELGVQPSVLLRLAPAIDPHTHRYLATGVADSKFGLALSTGAAMQAARRIMSFAPRLNLVGLHVHIGSQIFAIEPYYQAAMRIFEFAAELKAGLGIELQELDWGGGWGVAYTGDQESLSIEALVEKLGSAFAANRKPGFRDSGRQLLFEPGRSLIAQSAVALYTVGSVKSIAGIRTYVSVDGGMGDNIRPALYGARYTARAANKANSPPVQRVTIAGRYCEQGDILVQDVDLPAMAAGDLIAIPVAGAYQLSMASNYNLIPRPAVVAVREGRARLVRRRETITDLLGCELDE